MPEDLDLMVAAVDRRGWLALLAVLLVAIALLAWAVFGSLAGRVSAPGLLVSRGGSLLEALAPTDGVLSSLEVAVDDEVAEGDAVATLAQGALLAELDAAVNALWEARSALAAVDGGAGGEVAATRARLEREAGTVETRIASLAAAVERVEADLAAERARRLGGEAQAERIAALEAERLRLRGALADAEARREALRRDRDALEARRDEARAEAEAEVAAARSRLAAARERFESGSRIEAPAAGRIVELKAAEGDVLTQGQPVATVATPGDGLELALFLPPGIGKTVEPGMEVLVSPAGTDPEQVGSITGRVTFVSPFPASEAGMTAVLRNPDLVDAFSRDGPPYRASVALDEDPGSASGYAWTSARGRALALTGGTLAEAEITLREERPIAMLLPALRRWVAP